jgi:hypothetical protein
VSIKYFDAGGTTTPTTTTPVIADPLAGKQTGTESNLSNWAGDYVTSMLGKGQALAGQPYQAYSGPLTAGESSLQQNAFQGLANLAIPTDKMGAFNPQTFGADQARQYMNPYLMAALQPQIDEARRQSQITQMMNDAQLTKAGAYGGGRQAIMNAETQRNLGTNLANITGTGYASAYDKAMAQFNTEQGRGMEAQKMLNDYGMGALAAQQQAGAVQRQIEGEGIAADKKAFEEERDYPYKQVQYMQSLLQGLPLQTQTYSYQQPSTLSNIAGTAGGVMSLYDQLFSTRPATTPPATTPGATTPPGTSPGATTPTTPG